MKITVSSTSMMKPILHSQPTSQVMQQHPQRVVGLLEPTRRKTDHGSASIYVRSSKSSSNAITLPWQSFLQIPDKHSQLCAAVFGFEFDGEKTWYQLWNVETNQSYWLSDEDELDYQPYSIMAMDALVSLIPEWDGELHLTLTPNSRPATNNNGSNTPHTQAQHLRQRSQALNSSHQLLISDAAATATGQLWFLVTFQEPHLKTDKPIWDGQRRTGWISQNNSKASSA